MQVPKKKSQCTLRWWGMSFVEEDGVEEASLGLLLEVEAQPLQQEPIQTLKTAKLYMKR